VWLSIVFLFMNIDDGWLIADETTTWRGKDVYENTVKVRWMSEKRMSE